MSRSHFRVFGTFKNTNDRETVYAWFTFSHWLIYANSAANPIVYNFLSGKLATTADTACHALVSARPHEVFTPSGSQGSFARSSRRRSPATAWVKSRAAPRGGPGRARTVASPCRRRSTTWTTCRASPIRWCCRTTAWSSSRRTPPRRRRALKRRRSICKPTTFSPV